MCYVRYISINLKHNKYNFTNNECTLVNKRRSPPAARIKPTAMKSNRIPTKMPAADESNAEIAVIIPLKK